MAMQVTLTSIQQEVDLEDGSTSNFLLMKLPTGKIIRALITDDAATQIIRHMAAASVGVPVEEPPPPAYQHDPDVWIQGEEGLEFGGATTSVSSAPARGAKEQAPPQPIIRTKIAVDDMGNPIVPGMVSQEESPTSEADGDEDGVGQI